MTDVVEMQAPWGEVGWHLVDEPHRCSHRFCYQPAVIYYLSRTYGQPRRWTRRFRCAEHMNDYHEPDRRWWIDGDRLLRRPYPYEVERDQRG